MHQQAKLKIMTLTERTSGRGNIYLQGILNGLSVIAFRGEPNQWGETWDVYLAERSQKAVQASGQQSGERHPSKRSQAAADLFQRPLDRRG